MSKTLSIFKKVILYTFSIFFILSISGYIYLYVLPKGPKITDSIPLKNGKDSFVMHAYKESERKTIKVWTYKPDDWKTGNKIVFVMHGGGRNAEDYLDAWVQLAKTNNLLLVAPEFANKFSKYITNDYQEGNLFTFFGVKNPKEEWAYTVVENIFDHIKEMNTISNENYDIFGHSAGGQFVHKMILLMPEARIETAVAANSGFYTFPDRNLEFPYGMEDTDRDLESDLARSYKKKLIILLGELDNNPNLGTFRTTDMAMQQGMNRLERGTNFFNAAMELKNEESIPFNWEMDTVKNVGHNYKEMSKSAIKWLEN